MAKHFMFKMYNNKDATIVTNDVGVIYGGDVAC